MVLVVLSCCCSIGYLVGVLGCSILDKVLYMVGVCWGLIVWNNVLV